jgi:hypothetical protein
LPDRFRINGSLRQAAVAHVKSVHGWNNLSLLLLKIKHENDSSKFIRFRTLGRNTSSALTFNIVSGEIVVIMGRVTDNRTFVNLKIYR